jgi:creatinine amidohydrolase
MTDFFDYDVLTWPEVQGLPRDIPLLLPLGEGYVLDGLGRVLGEPQHAGLLPAFPFGWEGSSLPVPAPLLRAYISNLLEGLHEDGFTRVYVLAPQGSNFELGISDCELRLQTTCPEIPHPKSEIPLLSELGKVVLLPIGHTEQHGYHLPLSVDTLIIEAIGQGTAAAVPDQACCLPVMPYGVSTHRSSFAATLSAGGRAFEDFWVAAIDGLVERGFDRFYFLSGHGGNMSFLTNVVKYAGERHQRIFCATAFLYLSGPQGVAALEKYRRSPLGGMGHACELETSLILHLHPDLVHMERVVDETNFIATPSYLMDWIESGALIANPPWDDDTATGAYGAGSLATAEHGKLWLDAAIAEKVGHVAEIHEQHRRREERRHSGYGLWGRGKI